MKRGGQILNKEAASLLGKYAVCDQTPKHAKGAIVATSGRRRGNSFPLAL